ncbi:hypothetical protein RB614_32780 [Phytohabitans sp. ZYX-F-186]|uniref:Uncharacterized protein n=1 Tax=Phytohabitans maris TaxID=3071409 RepID=A0ABU0ZTN2_9ACTN|nr:hypothetical protein [Phytohabitans sp. ZYX-F-186]MDQ7909307.1 hypothetical protein [Phytohabitans sp. ZYX-F-186]
MFSWLYVEGRRSLGLVLVVLVILFVTASLTVRALRGRPEAAPGSCPRCGGSGRVRGDDGGDWPCLEPTHRGRHGIR